MGNQVLRDSLAYALADALNMTIESRRVDPQLRGETQVDVDLGGLVIPVKAKIISSLLSRSHHMAMVKVLGNMAVLAIASESQGRPIVDLFILNLAKMGRAESWLDANVPKSAKEAKELLGKAVVKSFVKHGAAKWRIAA